MLSSFSYFLICIQRMLWLIAERLDRGLCDDVLEVAWSTMWNVTDETPPNCQKFLENRGMEYFLKCLDVSSVYSLLSKTIFVIIFQFKM